MESPPAPSHLDVPDVRGPIRAVAAADWRDRLPILRGTRVTLRELEQWDAPSLLVLVGTEEVSRFISPPPPTVEAFERFIAWSRAHRRVGTCAGFAATLQGTHGAIGLFQLRELEPGFGTAEWGFALGSKFWGTGVFEEGADLMMDFAFGVVGVHRLEARAVVRNGRGNGALHKVGAAQEGILRQSFCRNGEYLDEVLWTVLKEDRRHAKVIWGGRASLQ